MKFLTLFLFFVALLQQCPGQGKQLTGPYTPAANPPLSPAEAQKKFVVPDGFEVRLFAAEPDVINPVAMTWDERGRLWVVELYEYPLGAPPGTKPRDRIKILEDTDNDGRADKVTVFTGGLNLATGILIGGGGVYVGQVPDLLHYSADPGSDVPKGEPFPELTGFAQQDRHELLNGFTWGPDGWLYLTQGVFDYSKVRSVVGANWDSKGHREVRYLEPNVPGVEMNAAVARFHPDTKKFEVFADGTSNPWGVDFDRYGNAFVSACVIDHLFHMIPGGIYVRQSGTPGNPYAYELLPSIVDHKHHMAAYCGVCIYQGDQFPEEYRGRVFMGNIHQNAINHDRLIPNGSSFNAVAEKDFLTTSDGWFRPISEQVGPDGALWIADWYDKYPCYQNAEADPEGVDRERGRIWRVVYTGKKSGAKMGSRPEARMNLAALKSKDLVRLLAHPNEWQRRTGQRLLSERRDGHIMMPGKDGKPIIAGDPAVVPLLEQLLAGGKSLEARLAALWTLHGAGTLSDELLAKYADDQEPAIRAWGARFSGEQASEARLARLQRMAADSDPTVRLAVAVAARELVSDSLTVDTGSSQVPVGGILTELIKSSADAKDPFIPFMIWMAGEQAGARNPKGGLDWLAENGAATMPLSAILTRKATRRICDTQDTSKLDLAVNFLERIADSNSALVLAALEGLIEGQKAKSLVPGVDTKPLFAKLNASSDSQVKSRAQELGTLWGDAVSIRATLSAINDANLSVEQRASAIEATKDLKNDAAREALLQAVGNKNPELLVRDALQALGRVGNDRLADELLNLWSTLTPATRTAAADVMITKSRWAVALLTALEEKRVSPSELSMTTIRAFADSKNEFVRQRATAAIGRIRPADADKQKIIVQKKNMIQAGPPPDLQAGHELAKKTCLICHKLCGEGAEVGPDLTGSGRSTLDALLQNVIDPNQVIGKGYENVEIETKDGRTLSGRLVEDTDTRVKLLSAGPKEEVIAKSDIASTRVSQVSVMPEGLEQMPDADFRNLILYVLNAPQGTAKNN
jgi:putative membrane-bound dehydrogenase-like protein